MEHSESPLRRERNARRWTLDFVASEIARLAAEQGENVGIEANAVSRHERRKVRRPRAPYPQLYAELYGKPIAELWPELEEATSLEPTIWGIIVGMERRTVLRLIRDAAVGGVVIGMPSPQVARALERLARADRHAVATINAGIANDRRLDDAFGSEVAASAALAHYATVRRLLHRSHADEVERALWAAMAELSQFLGWVAFDLDDLALARLRLNDAVEAATNARDDALAAYCLGYLGIISLYDNRPAEGLAIVEAAESRAAHRATPAARSWLATVEAEAHAGLRNVTGTDRALDMAAVELSRVDAENEPAWLYHYDRSGLTQVTGTANLRLGRTEPARAAIRETMTLAPQFVRERALFLATLGRTYALDGEVEPAVQLANQALDVAADTDSARAVVRVEELRRQLDPWRTTPAVRELDERLRAS